ncbi:mucin-3A [Rhineura floridana]|uniref:mucin-3A n=1 Tax=Rhineura floridana TaxID=261503 RepID=UPI002AC85DED|nr:mucin-3A [Rhineura floridana]
MGKRVLDSKGLESDPAPDFSAVLLVPCMWCCDKRHLHSPCPVQSRKYEAETRVQHPGNGWAKEELALSLELPLTGPLQELGAARCVPQRSRLSWELAGVWTHPLAQDLSAECKNTSVVALNLQPYYVAQNVSNKLLCVSNCSVLHPNTFSCMNGNCYIKSDGPNCYCEQSDSYWYVGNRCEQSISKVGVAVGVALGLAALLLLILILAILLCWRRCCRREKGHRVENPAPDEESLYENEPEWVARPRGPAASAPPMADSSEPEPGAGGSSGADEDSGPSSEKGSFRPRLDKVDTSLQTRIARPHVTRL